MVVARALLLILCGAFLLGCNRAGPHFRDVAATRVTVAGSTFDVRVKPRLAEAMRVNAEYAPRLGPIEGRAALAMQAVSGCAVTQVLGDAALLTGVLDCGEGSLPLIAGRSYDCDLVQDYASEGLGTVFREFDCYPVPFTY
jgi:hypothetical protein